MEEKRRNKPVCVMLKPEQKAWIWRKIEEGEFASVSHAIRAAITHLMREEGEIQ